MEIAYSQIKNRPILSQDIKKTFASLADLLMNPDTGKITAIATDKPGQFIKTEDILGILPGHLEINDTSSLLDLKDLGKQADAIHKSLSILEKTVKNQSGSVIGTVSDYFFHDTTWQLTKLIIDKTFLKVPIDQRVISAQNIIEINTKAIIIKDDSTAREYSMANPFIKKKELAIGNNQ